ncbi:hypothetical protein DPMN_024575 [Dreissena polymorpha]|uniref:Uncharacterized protein n=1 Tax=Dreissena polymorpha TaxID=45954 RepID=A0A9D4LRN7_DREPO|nr:hypothetical protein DPMN_024575 [Dreissena polymorpha]
MKLHRYIDHDLQMTPIDFEVTGSKVKVMVTRNSKMVFNQVFRRKKLVIRLANAGGLAGWLAGGLAGWLAGWRAGGISLSGP